MNKLTKIGASALAGSLVASAAHAGSVSVGATWEVTMENTDGSGDATYAALSNNGNPFGSKGNLSFSGSGETDFGTASWFMFTGDQQGSVSSHSITLDMGDMGLVGFDQGTGAFGLGTIDDKAPTAYEEVWNGTTASNTDLLDGGAGSGGVFGYKNTFMGFNVNVEIDPSINQGDASDGGNSKTAANTPGSGMNFAITNDTMVEGLAFGVGAGEIDWDRGGANTTSLANTKSVAGYANYSFGPVTIGYGQSYTSGSVSATGTHEGSNDVENLGIAFNVNDALSVSYQDLSNTSGNADVEQEMDGVQIAYTMGGATLRISDVSVSNGAFTANNSEDRTEISLLMAF
jgi:outer membrane protein OmpU